MNNLSEKSISCCKLGARCAKLSGLTYAFIVGLTLLIPSSVNMHIASPAFFEDFQRIQPFFMMLKSLHIVAAIAMIGVITAFASLCREKTYGTMAWISILGIIGYAIDLFQSVQDLSLIPALAHQYYVGSEVVRETILAIGISNPKLFLLSHGLPGLWFIVVSLRADSNRHIPKLLILLGFLLGAGHVLTALAHVFSFTSLIYTIAICTLFLAPLWGFLESSFLSKLASKNEKILQNQSASFDLNERGSK